MNVDKVELIFRSQLGAGRVLGYLNAEKELHDETDWMAGGKF